MYLEHLRIKSYRSISELNINLNKSLNIFIGENNSGKSAIIDALRIGLSYGNQKRDIYISKSDFHIDKENPETEIQDIEFDFIFRIEEAVEAGWFNDLLNVDGEDNQTLQLHFRYSLIENRKIKYKVWGGLNEGQGISPEVLQAFYHVYLGALRNTIHELRPTRGNRLGQLYSNIKMDEDPDVDREKKDEVAQSVKASIEENEDWTTHIESGKSKIIEHLGNSTFNNNPQEIDITFLPFDFEKLVDNLKINIPVFKPDIIGDNQEKQKYFELYQNGLGYNNLIYAATIFGDLSQRKSNSPESYLALLVEEPEAHLHPQLQNVFFDYLNRLNSEDLQMFITSHSPTITAKAELDSIFVLNRNNEGLKCTSVKATSMTEENKIFLQKFLDVTKSQLFFSKGVLLVEGISESLLMPILSSIIEGNYNLEKNAIELVNLNGVAFSHFVNMFNSENPQENIMIKCSILTDDDRDIETDEISSRAIKAMELERGNVKVFLANNTFEYELFVAGNETILKEVFAELHPIAASRIEEGENIQDHAISFLSKVVSNKAKSRLAHNLAIRLLNNEEDANNFNVPNYIVEAIKFVID
jgi:putative ATP-dependent endonuclease of OLD family